MQQSPSQVVRQAIRYKPTSSTEVNTERLPDPKFLSTMELRHREEPIFPPGRGVRLLFWLVLTIVVGSLSASLSLAAPSILLHWWLETTTVEGLPVVVTLLGAMACLIALLSLVFVPSAVRRCLPALALPLVLIPFAARGGFDYGLEAGLLAVNLSTAYLWYRSTIQFHNEWLKADPRVDPRRLQLDFRSATWSVPWLADTGQVLHRYLTYDAPLSGAAGVWIASASRSSRVMLTGVLAGSNFGLCAVATASAVPSLCASALLILAVIVWTAGKAGGMSKAQEAILGGDPRSLWEQNVDRVSRSEHVATDAVTNAPLFESEHLFLGVEPWQNFPVLIHRKILHEHAYFAGRTGSNKTSMGMMQHLIQIVRGHNRPDKKSWCEKSPVVIIDLKGDHILFQTAKAEAERRGQKFRFFSLEPGKATFRFNPFSGFRSSTITIPQMVQLCLDALNLNHGVGYGRGYYSQRSRFFLSEALRATPNANSFKVLYETLRRLYGSKKQDYSDAFELLSVVESLTSYWQLVTTQSDDNNPNADIIRLDRVLEEREVVYFWLPSSKESAAVSTIGKLVLFNLQTAAYDRQAHGKEKRQAYLLIDEFQKLAGENFQQILQQARSSGIAAVLANQSLGDLQTADWDLGPTIKTNTSLKMFFSMTEPEDIKTMAMLSGEELHIYGSEDSELIRPRLSVQELLALSDHPKRLLLQVTGGSGHTQFGGVPIPVETDWPISKDLADQREHLPWPTTPAPRVVQPAVAAGGAAPVRPANSPQSNLQQAKPTVAPNPPKQTGTATIPPPKRQAKSPPSPKGTPSKPAEPPNTAPTAKPSKPAPDPKVKASYAKKIQGLMNG